MSDLTLDYYCPHCKREDCVPASGPIESSILIIGEEPGKDEIRKGKPLVGATGGVLRAELGRLGIDMKRLRLCNLWLHPKNDNKDCFEYGVSQVIKEAKGRKAILLIGSGTVKYFCDQNVSDVSGLQVKSPYLSASIIVACVQPTTVWHGGIGELRLSLEKFERLVEGLL